MKPGWRTTEFWVTIFAMALCACETSGAFPPDSGQGRILALVGAVLSAAGYTGARAWGKGSGATANALSQTVAESDAASIELERLKAQAALEQALAAKAQAQAVAASFAAQATMTAMKAAP